MRLFRWAHRRPSHSRWTYPAVGAVLWAAALLGFVALRGADRGDDARALIEAELLAAPAAYGYLLVWTCVALVGIGWMLGRREEELWRASRTDPSTGLANRRMLQAEMTDALEEYGRRHAPVSLLVIDLDGLKTLNDVMGHSAGDAALRLVAASIRATCRATDLAARWGGDEFVVVARGTTAAGALELAERIRGTLRRLLAEEENRALPQVTVSIGISDVERAACGRPEALFYAADRALYQAKEAGRNRCVLATPVAAAARLSAITAPALAKLSASGSPRA